jgi:hypothetical protein
MPYIRGRYYMNPVVGDALEAAREAEAALQALEHAAKVARGDTGEEDDAGAGSSGTSGSSASGGSGSSASGGSGSSASGGSGANSNADASAKSAPGPIHRVEIEAAELVPAHSGRGQRGFVARIHRRANGNANAPGQDSLPGRSNSPSSSTANGNANASASPFPRNFSAPNATRQGAMHPAPETHVFSNHNDLTNFLHDQFAEDCK